MSFADIMYYFATNVAFTTKACRRYKMKKLVTVFMMLSLILTAGCGAKETATTDTTEVITEQKAGYVVNNPKARPDYSQEENPSAEQLRATALRAMQDFVSLAWTPDKYYTYHNPYDIVNKQFQFVPEVTFGGLPYTNAHTGLFQWYAFYDEETLSILSSIWDFYFFFSHL